MKRWLVVMAVMMAAIMPSLALSDEGTDLESKYGINRDPVMKARLALVGAHVIWDVKKHYPQSAKTLRFKILNDSDLNACALKDGRIYVTSGMMEALYNPPAPSQQVKADGEVKTSPLGDDGLAAVLSHEAAHVALNHHRRQMRGMLSGAVKGGAIGYVLAKVFGWDETKSAINGAGGGALLGGAHYSREDENAADAGAVQLLKVGGRKPMAMAYTLGMLKSLYGNGTAGTPIIGWLASHPDTSDRVARTTQLAQMDGQVAIANSVPTQLSDQVLSQPQQYRVAVIVRDRYSSGWSGFWGGQTADEAVQSVMKEKLEQTGRFIVADRESREEAWEEQDLGKTGRMDPETVPASGRTVGANFFLYIDLNYYQVTQEGEARVGNWQKGAKVRLVKAEIKGKARLVPVERSIVSQTADFLGSEIGHETEAEFNDWTRGSVEASWSSRPAGQAVEKACQRVAAIFAQKVAAPREESRPSAATSTPPVQPLQPDLEVIRQFTVRIRPDDWKGAGDERKTTIHFPATWGKLLTNDVILLGMRGNQEMVVAKLKISIPDTDSPTLDARLYYPYYRDLNLSDKITAKFIPKD